MFFVEHLSQLKSLNVSIRHPETKTIKIEPKSITINDEINLDLPCSVDPKKSRFSSSFESIHIQTTVLSSKDKTMTKQSNPNKFTCHACEQEFVEMKPRKVIDLPSDHWFELTECWACHHEDYTTLPGQVGGMIFAQKDILMVGKSYYMLHRDNVSHLELRITGKESPFKSNKWIQVVCGRCKYPIGQGLVNPKCEKVPEFEDLEAVKLFKYRVNSIEISVLPFYSFSHYFVNDLIESANANAFYRYILCDEETSEQVMLIWVLNWKCETGVIEKKSKTAYQCKLSPSMKVLYVFNDGKQTMPEKQLFEKWSVDRQVEHLEYPIDCLVQLKKSLKKATMELPFEKQSVAEFHAAMLRY